MVVKADQRESPGCRAGSGTKGGANREEMRKQEQGEEDTQAIPGLKAAFVDKS